MNNIFTESNPIPKELIPIILIWSLIWKGFALWKSAKRDQKYWFISLLLINTAGILEIFYLIYFSKLPKTTVKKHVY